MDRLWTIGHSTRDWSVFTGMLIEAGIVTLVDVRRFAGSRRHPQYSGEAMARALPESGIAYVPLPALGGRRRPRQDSPHTAWRNASFRGYADYMDTPPYRDAREHLEHMARLAPTAVMCAEAMWWQCHRSLIGDDFKARGRVAASRTPTVRPRVWSMAGSTIRPRSTTRSPRCSDALHCVGVAVHGRTAMISSSPLGGAPCPFIPRRAATPRSAGSPSCARPCR
ncbi:DUF488 family protein [Lysobacter cavernae]|uniref:DUF488 family protein n=1 Tax=Lysobacter cavernae TaxID=1685901 RepID=A0ABV7RSU8_9GAMM